MEFYHCNCMRMEQEEINEEHLRSEDEIREFVEEEIDKKSELWKPFQEELFQKKPEFIKTIMKCINIQTEDEKEKKHSAGYIYAFQSQRSLDKNERPFTIKIGATVETQKRIKWWASTDKEKYVLIFFLRSKHYKILETLVKLLFDVSRHFHQINGNLRVQWFEYYQDQPVFQIILYLDGLMKQLQQKYHPELKKEEEKGLRSAVLYKQILERIASSDLESRHQSKIVIFGRSDSRKDVFLEFLKKNIPYFSLNPLKRVQYVQFSTQREEGKESLVTEFSNWLQICRSARNMVPFFIVTQEDFRRERETQVIQSLKVIRKYYPLDKVIVVVIASQQSFRNFPTKETNRRFSAILQKLQGQRRMTIYSGIIVLERSKQNCHYLSINQKEMLENMERCATSVSSFTSGPENHDLARQLVEGFEVVLRPAFSQKMNKWLRSWRTTKTLNDLIPEQSWQKMRYCQERQFYWILLKMGSVIELTNQEKAQLLLYVHCYYRLHQNMEDSSLMKVIDTQDNDKRQWLRNNLWKKFKSHLQKLEKNFLVMSPDAYQLRVKELTMIALADNYDDIVAALCELARNERGRSKCHHFFLSNIEMANAMREFRTQEEQQRVADQLKAAVLNGMKKKKLTLDPELNKIRLKINLSKSGYPIFRYLRQTSHTSLGLVLGGKQLQEDLAILNISDSFQIENLEMERPLRGGTLIILARHIKVSGSSLLLHCLKKLEVILMATSYEEEHLLTSLPDSAKHGLTVFKPPTEQNLRADILIGGTGSKLIRIGGLVRHLAAIFKETTHFQ